MKFPLLDLRTRFAYTCNRCMSCCHDPHIGLDPYEIARLAHNRRLSTAEFIARYLTEGGIVLRNREDTACVMLGPEGCTVYPDRPQACRTYPLKRILADGREVFLQYPLARTSTGVFGTQGTIAEFLAAQNARDFFAHKDRYFAIAYRIVALLAEVVRRKPRWFAPVRSRLDSRCEIQGFAMRSSPRCRELGTVPYLIDVDRVVAEFCLEHRFESPTAIEKKIELHIRAIEERIAALAALERDGEEVDGAEPRVMELADLAGALGAATEAQVTLSFVAAVFGQR